jgi:hypothetical protein
MGRAVKISAILLFSIFLVLQIFQIDKTNAAVNANETIEAVVNVPPDVKIILGKACNDCHTNTTVYPWYSYIQPNGWFLKSHIDDGRRHLNLSIFATYDANKRAKKLEEICEELTENKMPLPSYTWIHRDAILTESEKTALCDWTAAVASSQ